MAKPRIFISSTYYDLKNVRADLERYIRECGYEPVLNERGNIPYGSEKKLEEYCYKEIELCDVLLSIIGGRFGSSAEEAPYSISQKELKTALELGKPAYIFVEKNVLAEFRTFEKNKDVEGIQYVAVDDPRVYQFLGEILALPINNPVAPFETSADVIRYLKEQWAGLFQRLLQEASRQKEYRLIENMESMTTTLKQLVTFLSAEKTKGDQAIRDILLSNHPIFDQIRKLLDIPYRIFFTNLDEFEAWIKARNFESVGEEHWDEDDVMEWLSTHRKKQWLFKIAKDVFDEDGRLRIFTPEEWKPELVRLEVSDPTPDASDFTPSDDDIPF